MSKLFGFLSVIFILTNEIICFQRFAEQPKYTEVNPGEDALLTCKIIDKRGTCSWQKDNKPVGIYPKKYEWSARPSTGGIHLDLQPPPQYGGDCSLRVLTATLDFDDGLWECQVTASDFTTQDALTSQPVRLVVRVAPQRPRLEHEGVHVPPGHNITVDSGAVATVKCVSHYGNPPAILKWFLGDQEISALGPQVNSTEPDNSRTWSAASVVQVPATKERHGEILRCLAFHESYAAKSVSVEARMDVKYSPSIRLIGSPEIDLEEDKDSLILRCVADANPPASVVWRRAGRSEIASLQESLQLRPVGRRDAGLYTCQAQNSVGTSEQLSVQLDVKYPPKILSAGPDRMTTAPLFSPAAFECVAEGNPSPTYKWVQRISHGAKYLERGNDARLVIDNVTYDYQGEYECRATNYINGQERTVTSDSVSLQVVGAPQVLRLNPSMHAVSVKKGESASLSLVVCADPRPHHVAWEWGSLRLEAGAGVDRFRADDVSQDSREDCYLATLHIVQVVEHDARPYYLVVENERGTDRHAIHLRVEEPLEMSYLLGIAGGCLAALLILICLCIYAVRGKKCCFKGGSGYKSSDKDSEKADLKSRSDSTSGGQPGGDSIYTTPAGFHHNHHPGHGSPEAMKSTATFESSGLLWPDETSRHEIVEHRRHPLQISASADTLLQRQQTTINKRASGGDLLLGSQRHQRDLFSGELGIPQITTHVGSVVHTFETMAMMRRLAEEQQQRQQIQHQQQQHHLHLQHQREYEQQQQQQHQEQHIHQHEQIPLSSYEYSNECKYLDNNIKFKINPHRSSLSRSGGTSNSTRKYNKLKKKSNECRQRIAQSNSVSLSSSYPKLSHSNNLRTSTTTSTTTTIKHSPIQTTSITTPIMTVSNQNACNDVIINRSQFSISPTSTNFNNQNNNSQYLPNSNEMEKYFINDDYRKNHFATLPRWKRSLIDENHQITNVNQQQSHVDEVVNKAFKDIFNKYGGGGEDDDDFDDGKIDFDGESNRTQNQNHLEKNYLAKDKQHIKVAKPKSLKKTPSESLMAEEQSQPFTSFTNLQRKLLPTFNLHRGLDEEDEAQFINDENENFLRGSTVSQSFIKNVKNHHSSSGKLAKLHHKQKQQYQQQFHQQQQQQFRPKSIITQNKIENLLMNQQKRSKSSNELLSLDEHETNLKNKFNLNKSGNRLDDYNETATNRLFTQHNSTRNFFHENFTTNDGVGNGNGNGNGSIVKNDNEDATCRPFKVNTFQPRTIDRAEI